MATITIPKRTYEQLKRHAEAYRCFAADFFEAAMQDDFEDRVRCEVALRESKGEKRYSLREVKKRYHLK